jgi:putative ABC transport system permease protein
MIVLGLVILLPLAAAVGVTLFDLLRRRSLRRMALRNVVRRPIEALLVVGGAALGTAIITSAFVVGDTFDTSIRDIARTQFGPVDEIIDTDGPGQVGPVMAALGDDPVPHVDGLLPIVGTTTAVAAGGTDDTARAEPDSFVTEIDFDQARAFGDDLASTGLADAGPTPTGTEAVINERLADDLDVGVGDTVDVFAYGTTHSFTVRTVLPEVGLAGLSPIYLPPGSIERFAAAGGGAPPQGSVLVSNEGGVFDGVADHPEVFSALEHRFDDLDLPGSQVVHETKQDLLDDAKDSGAAVRDMFTMMGIFSALVGVLLLVNLFVMLSEERKTELGMLRAVGMKRNHLVRLFGLEGGLYSLVAAGLGALGGIAVGRVLVIATESIFAGQDDDLAFRFDAKPGSLLTGALIGLAISLLTVWATSTRIARLNVIRAIRDLPDPKVRRTSVLRLLVAALGVLGGILLTNVGISGGSPVPTFIGPAVAFGSAVPLFSRWLPRRAVVAGAGALAGLWALVAVAVVPDVFDDAGLEMFVAQGVVLVGAAVALISQGDRAWAWVADRLADRGGLASRLAVAYPLARRGRTGMLLAMFALVIFTMTFMSGISSAELASVDTTAKDAAAGWDLWVDSSPTNPLPTSAVTGDPDIARTATLSRGMADLTVKYAGGGKSDSETWPVSGYDADWMAPGTPDLDDRLDRYSSDRAALAAVAADPTLAVASSDLLEGDGPPSGATVHVGDKVTAVDPTSGRTQTFTLAAFVDTDWNWNGLMVNRQAVHDLLGDNAVDNRMYVSVAKGVDREAVARRLTADNLQHGADAETFVHAIHDEAEETQSFIRLLQGYLGIGLLIGVLGLGVVMVRAVRERRRQIGMLRALGFSASVVRRAFLAEAGFIAIQGIVLGIGLGLVVSYQMLHSDVFGDPLPFTVPWAAVAVLLLVPGTAAMLAAVAPAAQAARIKPAVALRIAD